MSKDFTAENRFSRNIEGPAFDAAGNLYVVNYVKDGTIGRRTPDGEWEVFVELSGGSIANSIQFTSGGAMLLADFARHNVLRVDTGTRQVDVFCHDHRFSQPNDLCINSRDQVFATDPDWKSGAGQLWRIDPDGSPVLLESAMGTTNGIELSPDEQVLYVSESVQRRVWRYEVDGWGKISGKALLIEFDDFGLDGMKCDSDGNLYVTRYGKGTIAVVSPQGVLLREVRLKGKNCSNLVFGGPDGRTVYVTLQDRRGMEFFVNDRPGRRYRPPVQE